MTKRDYKEWHRSKSEIEEIKDDLPYFREGEVWWCRLGANVGHEEDGKGESFSRPVLILKKFNQFVFWALPLSTKLKKNPYYLVCECDDKQIRAAMTSQLRLISSKRLTDKITFVKTCSFKAIKKAIKDLL